MSLKNTFTSILKDSQKRVDILYDASKIVFFVSLFFFLLILFFVSAEFFDGFLQVFLLPSYVAAISSMGIFFSFFVLQFGPSILPKILVYILTILALSLIPIFLLPLIF